MKLKPHKIGQPNMKFNKKTLDFPSFFMISNLGGGGSDKYRETVYLDIFNNIPTLYNYYYLNKSKFNSTGAFATKWLQNISKYDSFADFIDYTRNSMIKDEKYYNEEHSFSHYNCTDTVYLLDSGAANIINDLLKKHDYESNKKLFMKKLIDVMKDYYEFADRYKFDLVIAFDIGGKYTFKGDERLNEQIISGNKNIKSDAIDINSILLIETVKYIKTKDNFYPKIFATVHGKTPKEYLDSTKFIVELETKMDFKFDGFALGGIASSSNVNKEDWNIDRSVIHRISTLTNNRTSKTETYNAIIASFAGRIVRSVVKDRPIHALGAGGKMNIIPLYLSGVNTFDCQTPGRRAYDGNENSTGHVYESNYNDSFSQFLMPIINSNLQVINTNLNFSYIPLNNVTNKVSQCGCESCNLSTIDNIKRLYSLKKEDNEYYYYSRQLLNAHGIWQHQFLCNLIKESNTFEQLYSKINAVNEFGVITNYIVNEFNYEL